MAAAEFRLFPRWPEQLVYEESESRRIEFECLSLDEPPQVIVPDAAHWHEQVPAWAREQRHTILGHLRGAGCVLAEVDGYLTRRFAPDERFMLEEEVFPPDRDGGWETLRLWRLPERERVLQLPGFHLYGAVRFAGADTLEAGLQDHARKHTWRVQIDLAAHTFVLQPNELPRPLSQLGTELASATHAATSPAESAPRPAHHHASVQRSTRQRMSNTSLVLGSLAFVAAGIWLTLRAETLKDRAVAMACVLFFSACACTPLLDRKRR